MLPIVKLLWRGFMRVGMRKFGELAESELPQPRAQQGEHSTP
jgi:hypothetical protein